MMTDSRLNWRVVRTETEQLESKLNELSDNDFEIFTVQSDGQEWAIVARKNVTGNPAKTMGFGAG